MKPVTIVMTSMVGVMLAACSLFQWAMAETTLSDANILAMLETINLDEIEMAYLAQQKATTQEVRTFASRMMNTHAAMTQGTRQLARRINVLPEAPTLGSTARKAHEEILEDLRKKSGSDFDHAYLKYQITMYEQAMHFIQDAVDSVNDWVLQQHLRQMRPALEGHVSEVRAIEQHLVAQN